MQAMPVCPECGEKVWDNRESKKNPKAPDFKCRDKKCEGAIWPDNKEWGREGTAWPVKREAAGPGKDASKESRDAPAPTHNDDDGLMTDADLKEYARQWGVMASAMAGEADRLQMPEYMLPNAAVAQAATATCGIRIDKRNGR